MAGVEGGAPLLYIIPEGDTLNPLEGVWGCSSIAIPRRQAGCPRALPALTSWRLYGIPERRNSYGEPTRKDRVPYEPFVPPGGCGIRSLVRVFGVYRRWRTPIDLSPNPRAHAHRERKPSPYAHTIPHANTDPHTDTNSHTQTQPDSYADSPAADRLFLS